MWKGLKIGSLFVLFFTGATSAFTQGLFESSLSGNHEKFVSNSPSLGGFIRSVAYVGNTPEEEVKYLQGAYGEVSLLMNAKAGAWAAGKADIRFKYGSEFQQSVSEINIREVYVDLSAGPAGLRAGKLISPWGKGSVFNPSEKITPLDPTVRSPEEDDMYLGVWAMQGRINLGPSMQLTGTWKPLYQSSVLLIDPVPMPDYVMFLDPVTPGVELKEGSYGINYDLHSRVIDASLYWFDGYHHWPGIAFNSLEMDSATMEPIALSIQEHPFRIRMIGLDFSIPIGSWIIRAEGAWQHTILPHEEEEYLPFPELSYTTEIERSGSHGTLLAGYYGKYILDYSPPIGEQVGAFNRLYNYQLEEFYHSVFLVWNGIFLYDRLELTMPAIYNITTKEWIFQPGVSYAPHDGIKISIGFSSLYGPDNSLFDLVGPVLNAGYLSLKLTF
ncbi:MAG: DUF1302 family protein [Bacteroidota bacterium]